MFNNNYTQDLFYNIESILKRFLDIDHLLSLCVQIPKCDTIKSAESKITKVCVYSYCYFYNWYHRQNSMHLSLMQIIHLKHTLELVKPLLEAISGSESQLLKAYYVVRS